MTISRRHRRRLTLALVVATWAAGLVHAPGAGASDVVYGCAGGDDASQEILDARGTHPWWETRAPSTVPSVVEVGLTADLPLPVVVAPGDAVEPDVQASITLPADLTEGLAGAGVETIEIRGASLTIGASGATPASVPSAPVDTITDPAGAFSLGGDFGTFTAEVPGQLVFSAGLLAFEVVAAPTPGLPEGLALSLVCLPEEAPALGAVPVVEVGPPTVQTARIVVPWAGGGTVALQIDANPTVTEVQLGPARTGTVSVEQIWGVWFVTYEHDTQLGGGTDEIEFTAVNEFGSTTGTLVIEVLEGLSMQQGSGTVVLAGAGGSVSLSGHPQSVTGATSQILITNPGDDGAPWALTAMVSDFVHVDAEALTCPATAPDAFDSRCIPGDNLGWNPGATTVAGEDASVIAGEPIAGAVAPGAGLGSAPQTLCHAPAGQSQGTFACGAGLALVVPASTAEGTYRGVLTLTLV